MPVANTVWPEGIPTAVKTWLETFYTLVDSKDSEVPQKVADLYTEDAVVYGMAGKATGSAGTFRLGLCVTRFTCFAMLITFCRDH
jgi:hypothetical protein